MITPSEPIEERMIARSIAEHFAAEWIEAWNSHNLGVCLT
jgi:hypothetical protein